MKQPINFTHEFVKSIPDEVKERTLYVSLEYATAVHKCACGCGHEVVTPLSPTDWKLTFDGVSVSLYPSIGNWGYACRSHYWIKNNTIEWSIQWSDDEIAATRAQDRRLKQNYYAGGPPTARNAEPKVSPQPVANSTQKGFWGWLSKLWS